MVMPMDKYVAPIIDFPEFGPGLDPEARGFLDDLDNRLRHMGGGRARDQVVAVLRALRGPDNQNGYVKAFLTVPVRNAAFPLSGYLFGDSEPYELDKLTEEKVRDIRTGREYEGQEVQEHYFWSVIKAVRALGLVQKPVEEKPKPNTPPIIGSL